MTLNYIPLRPGEKISPILLKKLQDINGKRKEIGASGYFKALSQIIPAPEKSIDEKYKRFLAGFILGEGSINVSAKKISALRFGIGLDPEFSVTQHVNRAGHLMALLKLWGTGRISYKSGSNATLVYVMDNRVSIEEKCIPFWQKYIAPYQGGEEKARFQRFVQMITALQVGKHKCLKTFLEELLPLWHSLRKQKGQSNQTFPDLQAARQYVLSKKEQESGDCPF